MSLQCSLLRIAVGSLNGAPGGVTKASPLGDGRNEYQVAGHCLLTLRMGNSSGPPPVSTSGDPSGKPTGFPATAADWLACDRKMPLACHFRLPSATSGMSESQSATRLINAVPSNGEIIISGKGAPFKVLLECSRVKSGLLQIFVCKHSGSPPAATAHQVPAVAPERLQGPHQFLYPAESPMPCRLQVSRHSLPPQGCPVGGNRLSHIVAPKATFSVFHYHSLLSLFRSTSTVLSGPPSWAHNCSTTAFFLSFADSHRVRSKTGAELLLLPYPTREYGEVQTGGLHLGGNGRILRAWLR